MMGNKRILVFSDFDSIRNIIVKTLVKKDFQVIETKTYEEAIAELNGTTIDLVITDIDVQAMASERLIEKMRDLTSYVYTPVILLHSGRKEMLSEKMKEFNIACFLNKPFDMQSFYRIIDRLT